MRNYTIFFVDDNLDEITTAGANLVTLGFDVTKFLITAVTTIDDVRQAIVSERLPDVFLLDINFPNRPFDGGDVAAMIRSLPGCDWRPIVFVSAHVISPTDSHITNKIFSAHLESKEWRVPRPVDPDDLCKCLLEAIRYTNR